MSKTTVVSGSQAQPVKTFLAAEVASEVAILSGYMGFEGAVNAVAKKLQGQKVLVKAGKPAFGQNAAVPAETVTITDGQMLQVALSGVPEIRAQLTDAVMQMALGAMQEADYETLQAQIEAAEAALEAAQDAAHDYVAEKVLPFKLDEMLAWSPGKVTPKATSGKTVGSRSRSTVQWNLDEYKWQKNGVDLAAVRTEDGWAVINSTSGEMIAACQGRKPTAAVLEAYQILFGLDSSMSVPRELKAAEAEAAVQ